MDATEIVRRARFEEDSIEDLCMEVFAQGGPLHLAGFEARKGQAKLSGMFGRAYDREGWTMAEAPCGTGKSAAYIVAGVLTEIRAVEDWQHEVATAKASGAQPPAMPQFVISTYAIGLQKQIITKDIPFILKALGLEELRAILLKGRNNYVCQDKVRDLHHVFDDGPIAREAKRIAQWAEESTGDREDIPFGVGGGAWARVSVMADDCGGLACDFHPRNTKGQAGELPQCFAELAQAGAAQAHIVVTNHHMLCMRGIARPFRTSFLALDEAHELEPAIRGAAEIEISPGAGTYWRNRIRDYIGDAHGQKVESLVQRLFKAASTYHADDNKLEPLAPGWLNLGGQDPAEIFKAISVAAEALAVEVEQVEDFKKKTRARNVYRGFSKLYSRVVGFAKGNLGTEKDPWAAWSRVEIVRGERRVILNAAPASVRTDCATLQRLYPVACMTSATLAVGGKLDSIKLMLGLDDVDRRPVGELVLPSPYDIPNMGALVIPNGPSPKDPTWPMWAALQAVEAVEISNGGALILCSSMSAVRRMREALESTKLEVRAQGEAGRGELLDWFTNVRDSVLVASKSFFQGVDVQGDSCRLVIIDRIPFSVPEDPLEEKVCEWIEANFEGDAFLHRTLPHACIAIAQAAGRLIRTSTDRGAVVLLDNRALQDGHIGATVRASLPGFPISRDIGDIRRVLAGESLAPTARRTLRRFAR